MKEDCFAPGDPGAKQNHHESQVRGVVSGIKPCSPGGHPDEQSSSFIFSYPWLDWLGWLLR